MQGKTENALRALLWRRVGAKLFSISFHNWYAVRNALLRVFGASVAPTSRVRPSATITQPWNFAIGHESSVGDLAYIDSREQVTIGQFCTISQHTRLLTALDDAPPAAANALADANIQTRGPITLEDDTWAAAEAMILPGVTVHAGSIIGARGTVRTDLESWSTFGGDPLRRLGNRSKPTS
jgi:putative colanic acid biosynthesis acetyltransferase WcaF